MKTYLFQILMLFSFISHGQCDIAWLKHTEGYGEKHFKYLDIDNNNNLIISGMLQYGTFNFENISRNVIGKEAALIKTNDNGNVIWAHFFSSLDSYVDLMSSTIDSEGNVYAVIFGSNLIQMDDTIPVSELSLQQKISIVKISPSGQLLWANPILVNPCTLYSCQYSIQVSGNKLFIAGDFQTGLIFQDTVITSNTNTKDVFIIKADTSGHILQTKLLAGSGIERPGTLSVTDNGTLVYAISTTSPNFNIDSYSITNSSASPYDVFCQFDTSTLISNWVKFIPQSFTTFIRTSSNNNKLHFTSTFSNGFSIDGHSLLNPFQTGIYLTQLDLYGNVEWVNSINSSSNQLYTQNFKSSDNYVYLVGAISDSVYFNNTFSGYFNGTQYSLFYSKFDNNGNEIESIFGTDSSFLCRGTAINFNNNGEAYIAAVFRNEFSLNGYNIQFSDSSSLLNYHSLIAKLCPEFNSVGLQNPWEQSNLIHLFPNPAVNEIFVNSGQFEIRSYTIYNSQGKIQRHQTGNLTKNIPLQDIKPGIYFIRFELANGTVSSARFVKSAD